jgi:hypothetical protein
MVASDVAVGALLSVPDLLCVLCLQACRLYTCQLGRGAAEGLIAAGGSGSNEVRLIRRSTGQVRRRRPLSSPLLLGQQSQTRPGLVLLRGDTETDDECHLCAQHHTSGHVALPICPPPQK